MIQPLNVTFDGKMDWFSFVVTIYRKPWVSPVNIWTLNPVISSFIQFWESWNSTSNNNHNNLQKGFMFVLNSSKVWIISLFSDKPFLHIVGDCWIGLSYRMFPNKTPINWVVGGFNLPGQKCQWGSSTPGWTSSICDILRIILLWVNQSNIAIPNRGTTFLLNLLVGGIPTPLKNMKVSWDYYSQ
jgi:hypothetical protein